MASGDPILVNGVNNHSTIHGAIVRKFLLTDAATGTENGVWIQAAGCIAASLYIIGSGSANFTVQIRTGTTTTGAAPTNSDHHGQIAGDVVVAANGTIDFAPLAGGQSVDWIKSRISSWTAGTANVVLVLVFPR
jgi:hypothetical protein